MSLLFLSMLFIPACQKAVNEQQIQSPSADSQLTDDLFNQSTTANTTTYIRATDRDFTFIYPQWKNNPAPSDQKLIVQVAQDGCAVFLEISNASFTQSFDSALKFLKSGSGKSLVSSNANTGIIEHKRWNSDKTQVFFSTSKFVACNDFTYLLTVTCDTKKITEDKKTIFEKVINSATCGKVQKSDLSDPKTTFTQNSSNKKMNATQKNNNSAQSFVGV